MGYGNCTQGHSILPPRDCPGIYKQFPVLDVVSVPDAEDAGSKVPDAEDAKERDRSCGFNVDHRVNLYLSLDLKKWFYVGDVFSVEDSVNVSQGEGGKRIARLRETRNFAGSDMLGCCVYDCGLSLRALIKILLGNFLLSRGGFSDLTHGIIISCFDGDATRTRLDKLTQIGASSNHEEAGTPAPLL